MPENTQTQGDIGYGYVFEIALATAPSAFTYIAELTNATPPSDDDDQVDVTHAQSPGRRREYVPGLTDSGEAAFEMNYVPGSPTDLFLQSIRGKKLICRLTFKNGVQIIFYGSRQGYERDAPFDDKKTATLTIKVSGEPVQTEPTDPRNITPPTIDGVAKKGVPLIAVAGVWAGASDFAYQWQADDVDIDGATGQTFVPKQANVGDIITVVVTASNSSELEAELASAPTVAVAA